MACSRRAVCWEAARFSRLSRLSRCSPTTRGLKQAKVRGYLMSYFVATRKFSFRGDGVFFHQMLAVGYCHPMGHCRGKQNHIQKQWLTEEVSKQALCFVEGVFVIHELKRAEFRHTRNNQMNAIKGQRVGGTPICVLYRYVPREGRRFLSFSGHNRGIFLSLLALWCRCNRP